jgi:hypothetical protein
MHARLANLGEALRKAVGEVVHNCQAEFSRAEEAVATARRECKHLEQRAATEDARGEDGADGALGTIWGSSCAGQVPNGREGDGRGGGTRVRGLLGGVGGAGAGVVELDKDTKATLRAAARAVESVGPRVLQRVVMRVVRRAAAQFEFEWLGNDEDVSTRWTSAQFEDKLCAIEAFVDAHAAEMAQVFPATWGAASVLLAVVMKEARQRLGTLLATYAPGTPRHQEHLPELVKMRVIATEFESVCAQRFPPPLAPMCAEDADRDEAGVWWEGEGGAGSGGIGEWQRGQDRGLSAAEMHVKRVLSGAFDQVGVGAGSMAGDPSREAALPTAAVFQLGDLEDYAREQHGAGRGDSRGEGGGECRFGGGFGVGPEWGEGGEDGREAEVGGVFSLERWGARLAIRQSDLGLVSIECLLLCTELCAGEGGVRKG